MKIGEMQQLSSSDFYLKFNKVLSLSSNRKNGRFIRIMFDQLINENDRCIQKIKDLISSEFPLADLSKNP